MFRMSMKILVIALFVLSVCSCTHSHPGHYPTGKNRPCCVQVSMTNVSSQIIGNKYYLQPARYHCVNAIIFNTDGGPICVHPKAPWVPKLIAKMTRGI